jgi:hypothetical protein
MARTLIRALAGSWYVLAFLSLFGMGAWYGWLEPPFLTYRNLPFPVVREPRPGEAVLLTVWRCNADDHERSYAISHVLVRESDEEADHPSPGPGADPPGLHDRDERGQRHPGRHPARSLLRRGPRRSAWHRPQA